MGVTMRRSDRRVAKWVLIALLLVLLVGELCLVLWGGAGQWTQGQRIGLLLLGLAFLLALLGVRID